MGLDNLASMLTTVTEYEALYTLAVLAILLIVVPTFMVMAFFGFKMFKLEILLYGIFFGYVIGEDLGLLLVDVIPIPYVSVITGVLVAVLGALISLHVYKLSIFITGFGHGYVIGGTIGSTVAALLNLSGQYVDLAVSIFMVILGAVCGYFFTKYYKQLIIISTSFIYPYAALLCIDFVLNIDNPEAMATGVLVSIALGTLLGILAMRWQFKNTEDVEF